MERLKILMVSELNEGNPYIDLLIDKLGVSTSVIYGVEPFYDKTIDVDIIHIHWPEVFTKWKQLDEITYNKIVAQLKFWKSKAKKIVFTRHNTNFHESTNNLTGQLYEEILSSADAIIHLSEYSMSTICSGFKKNILNTVIHHGLYDYSNHVSKEVARKELGIDMSKKVILIFGKIRHEEEKSYLYAELKKNEIANSVFVIPRWKDATLPSIYRTPLKRVASVWRDFYLDKFDEEFIINGGFVSDEKLQYYFNAADIVAVPRIDTLNSGVLFLGLSFNKVVVGIEEGGIGEVLKSIDYPTFDKSKPGSFIKAISKGLKIDSQSRSKQIDKMFCWDTIVQKHLDLYNAVI